MEKRGYSLAEYAAQHPAAAPPADNATAAARSYREQQEEREKAELLKESIAQQLQQGNAPELVLYTAIKAIGLLSADEEWAAACNAILDSVYADLAQQSLLVDTAAAAAARLEKTKTTYTEKTRTQLQRSYNGCKRLSDALKEALQAIDDIAQQDEILT